MIFRFLPHNCITKIPIIDNRILLTVIKYRKIRLKNSSKNDILICMKNVVSIPHEGVCMTIKKIAELAGVSTSTISRVLNNSGYVKVEVREKIEKVIKETGYKPSSIAKDLKRKETNFIGVIIPKINSSSIGNLVGGIEKILSKNNLQLLLAVTENSSYKEVKYLNLFKEKRVKGILLLGTEMTKQHTETLKNLELPLIVIGQRCDELKMISITQKERAAVRAITEKFLEYGHRKIGYVGVEEWDKAVGYERKQGYLEALSDYGTEIKKEHIYLGNFDDTTPKEGAKKMAAEGVTGIVAATDTFAIKIMKELRALGKRVPEDISVTGIGNSEMSQYVTPALSTVAYDYFETGKRAAKLLIEEIAKNSSHSFPSDRNREIRDHEMNFNIVLRESLREI